MTLKKTPSNVTKRQKLNERPVNLKFAVSPKIINIFNIQWKWHVHKKTHNNETKKCNFIFDGIYNNSENNFS